MTKALTQEMLKSVLHYDPTTGQFTRITRRSKAGNEAGYIKQQGYREIYVCGRSYYAHRLAFLYMQGAFPTLHVDHINHNKADNSWTNLRQATQAENNRNSRIRKDNKSGVKGVCRGKNGTKWCAYLCADKVRMHLGYFDSLDEAAKVVSAARAKMHGEFANQE